MMGRCWVAKEKKAGEPGGTEAEPRGLEGSKSA